MFLVYPANLLHEPRQLGVVLRKLRAPRLGQGGICPSAVVLDGPPQLRNDRVVEAPINNLNWDEDGLGEREDAEEWNAMFEDSEEAEDP